MRQQLRPVGMAVIRKRRDMWRKGAPVHCWQGRKLTQPLWKTVWRVLKKLKIKLPCHSAIPLLGTYLKETKSLSPRAICTNMFIVALFVSQHMETIYVPITDECT